MREEIPLERRSAEQEDGRAGRLVGGADRSEAAPPAKRCLRVRVVFRRRKRRQARLTILLCFKKFIVNALLNKM